MQSPHFDAADRAAVLYRRGCVALQAAARSQRRSRSSPARSSQRAGSAPATLLAANVSNGARAAISSAATGTPPHATPSGRSSSPRAPATSRRRHTRCSRLHSSPSASEWLLARFHAEQALEIYRSSATRSPPRGSSTTSAASTSCSATSRRPREPARGRGDCRDGRQRPRRRAGGQLARTGPPAHRPPARGARARRARGRAARRPRWTSSTSSATRSSSSRAHSRPRATIALAVEWLDAAEQHVRRARLDEPPRSRAWSHAATSRARPATATPPPTLPPCRESLQDFHF